MREHSYEKRFINAEGGFQIWQLRADGTERVVDVDHVGFTTWLLENDLVEVPFNPPETIAPTANTPSQEERIRALEQAMIFVTLGG